MTCEGGILFIAAQ